MYIKLTLGALFGLIALIFLCYFGYRSYTVFESKRLIRRAAAFASGGDLRQATLCARRALQLEPESLAAMRELAQIAETSGDKSAIDWRRKVCEREPNGTEDAAALAVCALQFKDIETAEKALTRIAQNGRETAPYHAAAAQLADAKKQLPEAENHWQEAVKLAPDNASYRLQFAATLLRTGDSAKRANARALLEQLRTDPKQRAAATRTLISDAVVNRPDPERVLLLAEELQAYPGAPFGDRILYLDVLRQLRHPKFTDCLTTIEKDASTKPGDLAALFSWMKSSGMSLLAIDFARTLPPGVMSKWPLPLALAECSVRLGDWQDLEKQTRAGNWGTYDFLRHAYLSHALRSQNKPLAEREWAQAEKDAESQPRFLTSLSRTASEWGWRKETTDLLWEMTKFPETRLEALETLYHDAIAAGDTPALYRALSSLIKLKPDDATLQNNLAQVSLLLNADLPHAQKLAVNLHQKEPLNAAYASTYAFALYIKGDTAGALRVLSKLEESQLREPSIAGYYGVFLAASGETAKAREFLQLGASAKLLPEERNMIAKAESSLK